MSLTHIYTVYLTWLNLPHSKYFKTPINAHTLDKNHHPLQFMQAAMLEHLVQVVGAVVLINAMCHNTNTYINFIYKILVQILDFLAVKISVARS